MRVLHLVGSAVSEFHAELSRLYAADCLEATAGTHEPLIAHVDPGGAWRFPERLGELGEAAPLPVGAALQHVLALAPDAALPQMFCVPGMTHYRALLDVLGIPYVGNAPDVMALTADKAKAKAVVAAAGVRVPEGEVLRPGEEPSLAPPVVVKPVDADNSLGITLVEDASDYPAALAAAFAHADAALVERYVPPGREVRCGVLERAGELVVLPLEEYRVSGIRGEADKLARDAGGALTLVAKDNPDVWIVPADDPLNVPVAALARRAHVALGCRDYSLFDVRVDEGGEPWFLEAGLYCSFARKSVINVMASAIGIEAGALLTAALDECKRRT